MDNNNKVIDRIIRMVKMDIMRIMRIKANTMRQTTIKHISELLEYKEGIIIEVNNRKYQCTTANKQNII